MGSRGRGDGIPAPSASPRLKHSKSGVLHTDTSLFLLWFSFKMRLKLEEPNTQAPGEREETLSPTSVMQDGIYDLWPFFKLNSLIFFVVVSFISLKCNKLPEAPGFTGIQGHSPLVLWALRLLRCVLWALLSAFQPGGAGDSLMLELHGGQKCHFYKESWDLAFLLLAFLFSPQCFTMYRKETGYLFPSYSKRLSVPMSKQFLLSCVFQ